MEELETIDIPNVEEVDTKTLSNFNNRIVDSEPVQIEQEPVNTTVVMKQEPENTEFYGGYTAGKSSVRPKKQKLDIQMSKPSIYPLYSQDGKATEYATDLESIQVGLRIVSDGSDPKEVYKDKKRLQALTFKHLTETKGIPPREAADNLGMDYELVSDAMDFWEQYKASFMADTKPIVAGFLRAGSITHKAGSPEMKIVDSFIKETDETVARAKDMEEIYKGLYTEYNENNGRADSPWNMGAITGSGTFDVGTGIIIGATVQGTERAIKATREGLANVGIAFGKETSKALYNFDPIEYGTGVMSAMLGESIGQLISKRFVKVPNQGLQTKGVGELEDMLDGLTMLDKYGINIGEEDLYNPEQVLTKIKAKKHNSAEVERLAKIYTNRNVQLMQGLQKSLRGMGITDARQLKAYADGEIPLDNMGAQFKEFIQDKQMVHKARMDPVYDSLDSLDMNPSGNQTQYPLDELMENLNVSTSNAKQINTAIRSSMNFILNTLETPASKSAKEVMNSIEQGAKSESKNFLDYSNKLQKVDDTILSKQNAIAIARQRLQEQPVGSPLSTTMYTQETIRKSIKDLAKAQNMRKSLVASKRESSKKLKKFKKNKKDNQKAFNLASVPTHGSIMQMNSLRRELNELLTGGTHMMDTKSKTHQRAIKQSIKAIDNWFDTIPTNDGKFLVKRLRYANGMAKEGYDKWGDSAFGNIDKLMDSDNADQMMRLFNGDKAGFHLKNLGDLASKDSEIYTKMAAKVLGDKLMKGVISPTGPRDMAGINWEQFTKNLISVDFRSEVKEALGPDVLKELNGVAYLSTVLGKHIDEAYKNIAHIKGEKRHLLKAIFAGTAGDAISNIVAGLEKYSGHTIKTKFYGGNTNKGKIKASLDDMLADVIEVGSKGLFPNTRYSTGEAIKEVEKELAKRAGNPKAIIDYIKQLASGKMRPGYIKFGKGSSELGTAPEFDLSRFSPKDKPFNINMKGKR